MTHLDDPNRFWTAHQLAAAVDEPVTLEAAARRMLAARRALETRLPMAMIADPALDILLMLFVTAADRRTQPLAAVESATTTAPCVTRRWVAALQSEGLVAPRPGGVALTKAGTVCVAEAVRAVIRSQVALHGL